MNIFKKIKILLSSADQKRIKWLLLPMTLTALINVIGIAAIVPFIAVCANPKTIFEHKNIAHLYHLFHFTSTNRFLVALGVIVLIALLLSNGFAILTTYFSSRVLGKIQGGLSDRFMSQCMCQPYDYFLNKNSAVVTTDLVNTISRFVSGFLFNVLSLITTVISVTFLVSMLFYVRPMVSCLVFAVFTVAFLAIYFFIKKKLALFQKESIHHHQQSNRVSAEAFQGIKDHKLCHSESYYMGRYAQHLQGIIDEGVFTRTMTGIPRNLLEIIAFGLVVVMVIYLILVDNNFSAIMPTLALFTFAGYRMLPAMQQIFQYSSAMKVQSGAVDVLIDYFDSFKKIDPITQLDQPRLEFKQKIKVDSVDYHYPSRDSLVLSQVNIEVPCNHTVGIIGSTGSGKTTLVDVMLGLLSPVSGQLQIDGVTITDNNRRGWQKNIGYVPQHIFLSDSSILHNIALGVTEEDIDKDAVIRAAKLAHIHDFIADELDDGYESLIGERGIQLSGGQRQRIGIARALYRDPSVLILDEATSALDQKTEQEVMKAIKQLQHKKTIIMIAHRLSTISMADTVYLMKQGRVIDQGPFNEIDQRHQLTAETT